ncbi:gastrula zinc finger protein XlCGF52.1 isoform X1 [Homalodisca vitripennis]|uniref:gastrula zinc finger protein XlCGF52.1 isoform X1 n=1 Tax=Homalodisca vitripennis TaxID=197043 RepID=UPI001EE9EB7F|nr:gastrula zinc finger protein XlCGF52.1 isoform X1 [Homalodisca vitripennis]KAG8321916.1 hypothetical protein J6590_037220 [Homalodisca vitripennis]
MKTCASNKCCRICNKQFARSSQLTQHSKSHNYEKPYNCSMCSAGFICRTNLMNHIKRHEGAADYICHLCGKSFVRRDGLKTHLDFHADLKTSHCKICNKKFKGHLMHHIRTHLKEKPHACSHCNMRFVQRSQLTVHERVHSGIRPYRCQVCHMAFSHSTALKMHVRRHTGEKPFKCLICPNKAFNQLPHLKKHMLTIHKTDKPYMCVGCQSFFKTKSVLLEHESGCQLTNTSGKKNLTNSAQMSIEKMRLLLACLFQKISSQEKLDTLGYGKVLIDEVLCSSIENSGRKPCRDDSLDELELLKRNIEILLDWTVPKMYMERFRREQRTVEDLLEELTT